MIFLLHQSGAAGMIATRQKPNSLKFGVRLAFRSYWQQQAACHILQPSTIALFINNLV
ncbi:MAG: hypothetical protein WCH35_15000 [Comamonadaceae bacterium]